jgi:hypothetical protein
MNINIDDLIRMVGEYVVKIRMLELEIGRLKQKYEATNTDAKPTEQPANIPT